MEFTPQQHTAITRRGGDLLVSAAAGSGKTSVLVERLLTACENGKNIDDFLVITYTRAAAGELRGRIQRAMSERRKANPKMWEKQLLRLHRAKIGTIHAFCAAILREHAVECGIRPDFRQLENEEERAVKQKALEDTLERLYAEGTCAFEALADSLSDIGGDRRLSEAILSIYNSLRSHPWPDAWMEKQLEILENGGDPWSEYLETDARRTLAYAERLIRKARRELRDYPDIESSYGGTFEEDLANIAVLKSDTNAVIEHAKLGRVKAKTPESQYFQGIRDSYKKLVKFNAPELTDEERASALELTHGLFEAVRAFDTEYAALKNRKNTLDFSDLEHFTHSLLRTKHSIRFEEVLVDEYQDVNQVQEEIIGFLKSPVFMVGDVRQSVYGFRQAEPQIFLNKYNSWSDNGIAQSRVILPHNFRSEPMLLNAVNEVFEKIMLGMEYGENEKLRPKPGTDTVIGERFAKLVYCDKAGLDEESPKRVQLEAEMCADICAREISEGAGEIAVLLRAKTDMPLFKRALAERGISAAGQEDNIYESLELATALAYLQILDNPRRDMPLLAVMRSPLYNFSPDELVKVRAEAQGDFYDALTAAADAGDSKCAALLQDLTHIRAAGTDGEMDALYHTMLEHLGLLELFGAMPDGELRRENLLGIIPIAAKTSTLSELCESLERLRDSGMSETASDGGVTLMTMHKSKGLEFDTVIVADLAHKFNQADARETILFHKNLGLGFKFTDTKRRFQYTTSAREAVARRLNEDTLCEETRLLYVALTRAKKKLYVTLTVTDIEKTLEKKTMGLEDKPCEFQLLSAKSMSDWMLLALSSNGKLIGTDTWSVEQWEPERSATPVQKQEPKPEAYQYLTHRVVYVKVPDIPSKMTVTELNAAPELPPDFEKPVFMEQRTKMSAAEKGTALHTAMQFVDFLKCGTVDGAKAELERLEREKRLTPEQTACVEPSAICGFVNSDMGRRVLASAEVKREFAFSLLTPASELLPDAPPDKLILLQGVIDLMFREPDGWVIVDFKTNILGRRTPQAVAASYETQIKSYVRAAERVTGEKISQSMIYFLDGHHVIRFS